MYNLRKGIVAMKKNVYLILIFFGLVMTGCNSGKMSNEECASWSKNIDLKEQQLTKEMDEKCGVKSHIPMTGESVICDGLEQQKKELDIEKSDYYNKCVNKK